VSLSSGFLDATRKGFQAGSDSAESWKQLALPRVAFHGPGRKRLSEKEADSRCGCRAITCGLCSLAWLLTLVGCSVINPGSSVPTATRTGTPAVLNAGQQVALSWTTLRAINVQIDHGVGPVMPVAAGSITVTPTQTTTYTLTAANANGATATATFTVTMNPPTVSTTANPTIIAVGNSSTLSLPANDATQVVITDNTDSNTYTLPGTGGTQTVARTATTTYTATATAGNQTATATSIVT